jgi:hypothetical protein
MTCATYERSCTSTRLYPRPYPSIRSSISRVDGPGNDWFNWPGYELHLRDVVWLARMQTACHLLDRTCRSISNRDPVLDQLLEDGTFDCNGYIDTPNLFEEFAMGHSSVMANRLLMRIESLEAEVRVSCLDIIFLTDGMYAFSSVTRRLASESCIGMQNVTRNGRSRQLNS